MVSSGSHYLRVWDVNSNGQVLDADNPVIETIALRSAGIDTEQIDAHSTFETVAGTYVVKYDERYYVTMAAELRLAGDYNVSFHTIRSVRHERTAGVTVVVLETRAGTPGYDARAFSDGFSDGFA